MFPWPGTVPSLSRFWLLVTALALADAAEQLRWLLADKGPFHRAQEFTEFTERFQQGFTTRYKIYREFGRWKVNNLAAEKQQAGVPSAPFDPEFVRNVRKLGRRPSLQKITEGIIKKYGTHFLVSATLGGEESLTIFVDKRKLSKTQSAENSGNNSNNNSTSSALTLEALHQLAASYFIDRDSTLRKLHHLQIASTAVKVTETRTGPLGCSNYDNLDSVSSVLVHSPENKIQLQGLQSLLPGYLRSRFVQAALAYVGCNAEGRFVCHRDDCWCQCDAVHPECDCPRADLRAQEAFLQRCHDAWSQANQDFEESDELRAFVSGLPTDSLLNSSSVQRLWNSDSVLMQRYRQLETRLGLLLNKAKRSAARLFSLSRRCRTSPKILLPRERSLGYWLRRVLSALYCSGDDEGSKHPPTWYSEEMRSCQCPPERPSCQSSAPPVPCAVGDGPRCTACSPDNRTRCSGCNDGFALSHGSCRPAVPDPTDHYLALESHLQDRELRQLLRRGDARITARAALLSNDLRLDAWFRPAWRKRMLMTLKSSKQGKDKDGKDKDGKSGRVHILLGITLQICSARNNDNENVVPDLALSIYVNPFGGSHSESWNAPLNRNGFPDWERTKVDAPPHCYNWTLTLGNRWKSFFETVHLYLRSRTQTFGRNVTGEPEREPAEPTSSGPSAPTPGYVKITKVQLFGYSAHFDPEAIQDLILQLDYPYTQGSRDSALLQLTEIRHRINRLSPLATTPYDLFSCLLRHRLKLSGPEVTRILAALQEFGAKRPHYSEYEATKLCS